MMEMEYIDRKLKPETEEAFTEKYGITSLTDFINTSGSSVIDCPSFLFSISRSA